MSELADVGVWQVDDVDESLLGDVDDSQPAKNVLPAVASKAMARDLFMTSSVDVPRQVYRAPTTFTKTNIAFDEFPYYEFHAS